VSFVEEKECNPKEKGDRGDTYLKNEAGGMNLQGLPTEEGKVPRTL